MGRESLLTDLSMMPTRTFRGPGRSVASKAAPKSDADAEPSAEQSAGGTANKWDEAIGKIRATSTWLGGALAAIATLIFGAGPLIKDFSGDLSLTRWVLVLAGIIVGMVSLVYVLSNLVAVQIPSMVHFDNAPQALSEQLPRMFGFPQADLAKFQLSRKSAQNALVAWKADLAQCNATVQMRQTALNEAAQSGMPLDAPRAELTAAIGTAGEQAKLVALQQTTVDDFDTGAASMLDVVRFERVRSTFFKSLPSIQVCSVLAVLGAIVYLAALGGDGDAPSGSSADNATATASAPAYSLIIPRGKTGHKLWEDLGIDKTCTSGLAAPAGDGRYTVTFDDQFAPGIGCPVDGITFTSDDSMLTVVHSFPEAASATITTDDQITQFWKKDARIVVPLVGAIGVLIGVIFGRKRHPQTKKPTS